MPCSSPAKPPTSISDSADQRSPTIVHDERNNDSDDSDDDSASSRAVDKNTPTEAMSQNQPPLPAGLPPPLPDEAPPTHTTDDGWEPVWDESAQAFYFYNRFTQKTQWENPRVVEVASEAGPKIEDIGPPGTTSHALPRKPVAGGYDPAIHGDYDPNADYAKVYEPAPVGSEEGTQADPVAAYGATGAFNRFTGKWQSAEITPDKFSDENKSKRQMNAFFDVDAAANAHDGRSLKAERSGKKISKDQLKAYREKRKEKKEEKRRAWLRD